MNFKEALDYTDSIINYEVDTNYAYTRDLNIERMQAAMALLGMPQQALNVVLVAGTKGKGSTACLLSFMLRAAGLKVAVYASPHLHDLRERFNVSGQLITEEEYADLVTFIREKVDGKLAPELGGLTFFELLTCVAYLHFFNARVDLAIMEVGLGGRLDATNVVDPVLSVLTRIGYDHEDKLGNSLRQIAGEKAFIIKSGKPFISARQEAEAKAVISSRQIATQSIGHWMDEDFSARVIGTEPKGCRFDYASSYREIRNLQLSMGGLFQVENAACAIAAAEALSHSQGFTLNEAAIRDGLIDATIQGRFELMCAEPVIVVDGAHNGEAFAALAESLKRVYPNRRWHVIFAVSEDKNLERIAVELKKIDPIRLLITKSSNPRSMPPARLGAAFARHGLAAESFQNFEAAVTHLMAVCGAKDGILIAGSLFLAAEARACLLAQRGRPLHA